MRMITITSMVRTFLRKFSFLKKWSFFDKVTHFWHLPHILMKIVKTYINSNLFVSLVEKTFHTIFGSVDERSSRHSLSSFSTPTKRLELEPKKRSSQISRELSDLVIYIQAIKFRGLNPFSPQNSVRLQQPMPTKVNSSGSLVTVGSILKTSSISPCAPPNGNNKHQFLI